MITKLQTWPKFSKEFQEIFMLQSRFQSFKQEEEYRSYQLLNYRLLGFNFQKFKFVLSFPVQFVRQQKINMRFGLSFLPTKQSIIMQRACPNSNFHDGFAPQRFDEEEFLALVYLKVVTYSVLSFNKNRSLKPKYNKKAIILFFSEIELIKKTYRLKPHCIVKKS